MKKTDKISKIVVTSHIPRDLYEKIRNQAFLERISIARFIRNSCEFNLQTKENKNETKHNKNKFPSRKVKR